MFTTDGRLFSNGSNGSGPHSRVRWTLEMVSCDSSSSCCCCCCSRSSSKCYDDGDDAMFHNDVDASLSLIVLSHFLRVSQLIHPNYFVTG
jgi:hypothetical protein